MSAKWAHLMYKDFYYLNVSALLAKSSECIEFFDQWSFFTNNKPANINKKFNPPDCADWQVLPWQKPRYRWVTATTSSTWRPVTATGPFCSCPELLERGSQIFCRSFKVNVSHFLNLCVGMFSGKMLGLQLLNSGFRSLRGTFLIKRLRAPPTTKAML